MLRQCNEPQGMVARACSKCSNHATDHTNHYLTSGEGTAQSFLDLLLVIKCDRCFPLVQEGYHDILNNDRCLRQIVRVVIYSPETDAMLNAVNILTVVCLVTPTTRKSYYCTRSWLLFAIHADLVDRTEIFLPALRGKPFDSID
jgi:hypothetical protein